MSLHESVFGPNAKPYVLGVVGRETERCSVEWDHRWEKRQASAYNGEVYCARAECSKCGAVNEWRGGSMTELGKP